MSGSGIKNKSGLQRFIYPTRKSAVLDADSTLSDRYQTTVPKLILQALALRRWEKIHYQFQATGEVAISRSDVVLEEGPMLVIFLAFVARDMATRPKLRPRCATVDRWCTTAHWPSVIGVVTVPLWHASAAFLTRQGYALFLTAVQKCESPAIGLKTTEFSALRLVGETGAILCGMVKVSCGTNVVRRILAPSSHATKTSAVSQRLARR